MTKFIIAPALFLAGAFCAWGTEKATLVTNPSPLKTGSPATITITTSDLGNEVYLYAWSSLGTPVNWEGCITEERRMSGSNGTYTITISDLGEFMKISDNDLPQLSSIGLIARSRSMQTEDLTAEVVYTPKSYYSGGAGTAANPYIISTAADMQTLAATPEHWDSDYYFTLSEDIDLGVFPGIGSINNPFIGNFDGAGHCIKNAKITSAGGQGTATGLFNAINAANISNLGVVNAEVSGCTYTGILAGHAFDSSISRCFTSGKVSATSVCAGGFIGYNESAIISDCYSTADVFNTASFATGGFVGRNTGSISNIYASGTVNGFNYTGGIAGANYGSISNSVAINKAVAGAADSDFAGRFGGNANERNNVALTLSWFNMPLETASGAHAHHATDHSEDLLSRSLYAQTLGWDFADTWEWRSFGNSEFAVLKGLSNQELPDNESFFSGDNAVSVIEDEAIRLYPESVESTLYISGCSDEASATVFSLDGATKLSAEGSLSAIDCSSLNTGVYIVRIIDHNIVLTRKIIKK